LASHEVGKLAEIVSLVPTLVMQRLKGITIKIIVREVGFQELLCRLLYG